MTDNPQHPPATLKHDPEDVDAVAEAIWRTEMGEWDPEAWQGRNTASRYAKEAYRQAEIALGVLNIEGRINAARREERERWLTDNTIEMPDWVESAVMTRANYDDPWAVSLTGDSHGVGKSSLVAALAPTLREACNKAIDQHEGWQSFVLLPQEAPDER